VRKRVSTGSLFEETAGYSRAIVAGKWCFVSGTTGYDYASMTMPDDVATQCKNALATIDRALGDAGFARTDIVRARYVVTDASHADIVFPVLGQFFSGIRPAATMTVGGLIRPEMKIEIDVTALRD
jgi:enamine deaminase RidA (YjgF/YER057c/UK114 family)